MEDCVSCRVVGTAAFAGLGAYSLWQRRLISPAMRYRRAGLVVMATGLFGVSAYRWFK
jgi:hypothetical protein